MRKTVSHGADSASQPWLVRSEFAICETAFSKRFGNVLTTGGDRGPAANAVRGGTGEPPYFFSFEGSMKIIPLTQGYVACVDDQDYERVKAAGPDHAAKHHSGEFAHCNFSKRKR